MGIPELRDDEVEVAIAGRQHGHVDILCELDHVEGDAHVPVTLRGAIASLNEGLELHLEADGLKDLLEPDLLLVPEIDSVGEGSDDLSSSGDLIPEYLVIEMTSVALLHRVVDVLHVHEDRDSIHGVTCPIASPGRGRHVDPGRSTLGPKAPRFLDSRPRRFLAARCHRVMRCMTI